MRTRRQCLFSVRKTAKNDLNSLPCRPRHLSRTNERGDAFGLAAAFPTDLSYNLAWDSEAAILLAALLTSAALGKPLSSAPHIKPRLLCWRFTSGFSNVHNYAGSTGILLSA